jgi:hypothetical protein
LRFDTSDLEDRMTLQDGAYVAAMVSATSFVLSVIIAIYQINRARHLQKYAISAQLWDVYLGRAIQYPAFAYPPSFRGLYSYNDRTFNSSTEEFERYEWFLSSLIRTCDEVINQFYASDYRSELVWRSLRYHREYLTWRKKQNIRDDYLEMLSPKLKAIIDKIIRENP